MSMDAWHSTPSFHPCTIRAPTHPPTHPPTQARGGLDGASLFRATFGCFVGAVLASKRDATLWAVQSRAWAALDPAIPPWSHRCSEAPPKVPASPHAPTGVAGAILAWIADIVACDELQQLPLGLPYPQLHAFGWHLGT